MIKVHLKNDLGISKATIKKCLIANDNGRNHPNAEERGFDHLWELLDRRTQTYTIDDAITIIDSWWVGHDQCVADNGTEEFSHLEVWQNSEKWDKIEATINHLQELRKEETK